MTPAQRIAFRLRVQVLRAKAGEPVDAELLADLADAFEASACAEDELGRIVRDAVEWLEGTAER